MDFDPTTLKLHHLFGDDKTILFHQEPGYRVYLTRVGIDQVAVQEEWDGLEELLASNAAASADFNRNDKHGDMVQVASVPRWVDAMWTEQCRGDPECIRRKLNDPDNAKFRTNSWRV